jgi:hypothetical protein
MTGEPSPALVAEPAFDLLADVVEPKLLVGLEFAPFKFRTGTVPAIVQSYSGLLDV